MIPSLALLVWAYVVARLLQVPIEFLARDDTRRSWLAWISAIGILVASWALWEVFQAAQRVQPSP